jgi:hypothetical protein
MISNGPNGATAEWLREMLKIEHEDEYAPDGMATGSLPIIPSCQEAQATARSTPCVAEADEDYEFRPLAGWPTVRETVTDCDECRPDMVTFYLMRRQAD